MAGGDLDGSLADADLRILKSGHLADATIFCQGREWKVHTLILSTRCKWFRTALCGKFVEASTHELKLEEQDPDLIEVLLRFIYSRDLKLPEPSDDGDAPAFYVRVFRVGGFFLLDELKAKAVEKLKTHLDNTPTFIDTKPGYGQDHKWVTGVLKALKEAYKDDSTKDVVKVILNFICLNMRKVFRSKKGKELLRDIPEVAQYLVENHITGDLDSQGRTAAARFGLPVLVAVESSRKIYQSRSAQPGPAASGGMPCLLYPSVKDDSWVFTVVDPSTGKEAKDLQWMAPPADRVFQISSQPGCDIVKVERKLGAQIARYLYLCFDDCADAKIYIERYCQANKNIISDMQPTCNLGKRMRTVVEDILKEQKGA